MPHFNDDPVWHHYYQTITCRPWSALRAFVPRRNPGRNDNLTKTKILRKSTIFGETRLPWEHVFRIDTFTPSRLTASRLNGNGITLLSAVPGAKCQRPPQPLELFRILSRVFVCLKTSTTVAKSGGRVGRSHLYYHQSNRAKQEHVHRTNLSANPQEFPRNHSPRLSLTAAFRTGNSLWLLMLDAAGIVADMNRYEATNNHQITSDTQCTCWDVNHARLPQRRRPAVSPREARDKTNHP